MKDKYHRRWLIMAPIGLILVGMGTCLAIESAFLKHGGSPTWQWVAAGTFSLVVLNSGLCLFGDAIISKVRHLQLAEPK